MADKKMTKAEIKDMVRADREHYESGDAHADAAVGRWQRMFAAFDAEVSK